MVGFGYGFLPLPRALIDLSKALELVLGWLIRVGEFIDIYGLDFYFKIIIYLYLNFQK